MTDDHDLPMNEYRRAGLEITRQLDARASVLGPRGTSPSLRGPSAWIEGGTRAGRKSPTRNERGRR